MPLFPLSQFLLRQAIRSPLFLANPIIIFSKNISLPRLSILHYLDINLNNHFPTRDLIYFKDIPKNKKIPIWHIDDLNYKEEITTLLNKYVSAEIRKWQKENIRNFKTINLLETPNKDINLIGVFNYNLLKDKYKYKTSLLSNFYKYSNLYKTYFDYVKQAVNTNTESIHFIKVELPNLIPSYNIINVILKFNTIKYTRIIKTFNFKLLLDIYKWLENKTRINSVLANITDEESERIIIEFTYKGYSSFLPLHLIRSISIESTLENKIKVAPLKVQRLFIAYLHNIQTKVEKIIEELNKQNISSSEQDPYNEELQESIKEENENDDITDDSDIIDSTSDTTDITSSDNFYISKLTENKDILNKMDKLQNLNKLNINELDSDSLVLNKDIEILDFINELELKESDNIADSIYEESILKLEKEDIIDEKEIPIKINTSPEYIEQLTSEDTLEKKIDLFLQESAEFKTLSSSEIRSFKKLYEQRKNLKSPYNTNIQIDEFKQIKKEDIQLNSEELKLNINNELVTEDLKKEVLSIFDKQYVDKVLQKDVTSIVTDVEKAGIIIKDYTIDKEISALGSYEIHRLTLKPLNGKESTVYFRLPKITSEGEFIGSGIKYTLRKQRTDLPIRKISPTKVALTSNYGKIFIFKTPRKTFNTDDYIVDFIKESYLEEKNDIVSILPGNSYDNLKNLPNTYMFMSMHFDTIETSNFIFNFNFNKITNYIKKELHKELQEKNLIFIGTNKKNDVLVINNNDNIINYNTNENLGSFVELLNIPQDKLPFIFTSINILGDEIPLGVVLSYYLGLNGLLSITNSFFELIPRNNRFTPNKNQIVLIFSDYKLIITPSKKEYIPLFNGFFYFKNKIKEYEISFFNSKDVYLDIFEFRNLNLYHIKELDNLKDLFIDSITKNVLEEINEPTTFIKLLLRANELLNNYSHPDMNDPNYSRIRGYDRVPGFIYRALTESIREYKLKRNANSKISLDPYKVWNLILQDNTKKLCEDANPIGDLKEREAVTITGIDGLNKDAVPKKLREFHKNDMGLFSEATVDSGDVAINTFLTPYAKIDNVRGIIDKENNEFNDNPAKLLSTSALLIPGVEHDDPKRINFISIQNGHTIPSPSYRQSAFRTEYEYIIPYRVGELYCKIAKRNGIVIEKTDKLLIVKYEDNTTESIMIGKRYGRLEGTVYSHNLISPLNKNDKFKENDILSYNDFFFEPDWLDSKRIIFKFGRNATIALAMTNEVFEDSSAISKEFSEKITTFSIKERSFIIEFTKNIINLLPVGTKVEPNTILFTLVDENTNFSNLNEETVKLLQSLANLSPKAKVYGVIDKYEVRYNGDISDMSPSLRKIVTIINKEEYEATKGTEYEIISGQVNSEYNVNGKSLLIDTLELKVYLKTEISMGIGDKAVFAGQMKSVNSAVFEENIHTESGEKIDAFFSQKGILNRIVSSMYIIGTTNRLLKHISKQIAEKYFSK